jgi:D-3-phosphoglycerate dehydrogenase / 2-oxoglutarate reductase
VKIFISARMDPGELTRLREAGADVVRGGFGVTGEKLNEVDLIKSFADVDIAIIEFENITAEVFKNAANLKYLACLRNEPSASVDMAAAQSHKIPILFAPGRNAVSVAEHTLGLMLSVARNIPISHHLLRYTDELTSVIYKDKKGDRQSITSEWSLDPGAPFQRFQGEELFGKTAGIVGFGAIGREIAKRLQSFGMNLITYDPYVDEETLSRLNTKQVNLESLARESDFIVMAAKVTDETKGLFSAKYFEMMKPEAFFINTARAALVDYVALVNSLSSKKIAGAALDVYPVEPLPSDSKLRQLDNVVLTPHLAGASRQVVKHHSKMVVDDVLAIMRGDRPKNVFNREVL